MMSLRSATLTYSENSTRNLSLDSIALVTAPAIQFAASGKANAHNPKENAAALDQKVRSDSAGSFVVSSNSLSFWSCDDLGGAILAADRDRAADDG